MHRLFFWLSSSLCLCVAIFTGCNQQPEPAKLASAQDSTPVPPGEAKPIPPGEAKPIPRTDPADPSDPADPPLTDVKTDQDTLPVLPTLSAPTGQDKYDSAVAKAFLLIAEKKDQEALDSFNEALAVQDTAFVKEEIERLQAKMARSAAAQKAADDIKAILDAGRAADAANLATQALEQYGDSDLAETLSNLKRQADSLVATTLEEKDRQQKFLDDAETARKGNNFRTAVLSFEQAVANGADGGDLKDTYENIRVKLAKYDENRTKASELRKDPAQLEQAVTTLKVAAEQWDTPQVRQEISETELALNNRRDRVAVAEFEVVNDIGIPRAGHVIAEEIVGHFRPKYDVVERSQAAALLEEMKIDRVALYENEVGRSEFGRLAKARFMVLGSVSQLGGIHVNARLVDTQTGLIVQTARVVASSPEEMSNRLPALARMLQMNDEQKRDYERQLAEQARPVAPPAAAAEVPAPPPAPAAATPAPPPIIVYTPRPPEYGQVVVADFDGFRVVEVGAPAPQPIAVVEAPVLVRDRAFFVAIEVGDNCFRRGLFRDALRHFEFALSLNPGHWGVRARVQQCQPYCPPIVVVPVYRPRLVVLPFAEFRDPLAVFTTIAPGLGLWTADALAPYFSQAYDVVDKGELFWWMGRLGLSMRDVLTNPYARLTLGRALGARYFLMGALREVASFDVTTHIIDAELNAQTTGARIRVNDANELRYRLGELANLTLMRPQQQVVVVQQQQVVRRTVQAAQIEIGKGRFHIALGFYREVLETQPNNIEVRQAVFQLEFRSRQAELESRRQAAWQQQQAGNQINRDRQIAFAAASEAVRQQAERDRNNFTGQQQKLIQQQQLLAQQNLLAQAQLAQRQNNLEQRVALLESAHAINQTDSVSQQLAQARAQLAVERQKRLAAEQALRASQNRKLVAAEAPKIQGLLAVADQSRRTEIETRQSVGQAEYDRLVDAGQRAMTGQKYAEAASAYQAARRIKPSPEIEKLVSAALVEQARADATKKGDAEKKKLEAQLAQEEQKRKEAEAKNAELQAKYEAALTDARTAMKSKNFAKASTSFKLASATIRTDESLNGLRQAEDELAREKALADADARKKAEEARKLADLQKRRTEGRAALAAKQFDKALVAFKAAAVLAPSDLEVQKELASAEQAQANTLAEARKAKEDADKRAAAVKLLANAQANLKAKQYDAAIVGFGDALKLAPDNKDAATGLEQAKSAQAAMLNTAAAQAEAKKKRADYEKQLQLGRAALNLKQYDAALKNFQAAQDLLPGDATSASLIKDVNKAMGDSAVAKENAQKAAELSQTITAARTAIRGNKLDDAQTAFDKATLLSPSSPEVKKLAAELALAKKNAVTVMPKKDPEPKKTSKVPALLADARKAIAAKDLNKASSLIAEAAVEDPRDPDIKKAQGEYEVVRKAMAESNTAAMDAKKKQEAYLVALRDATNNLTSKKFDAAIKSATEALTLKPKDPTATKILNDAQAGLDKAADAMMEAKKKKEAYDSAIRTGKAALAAKEFADAGKAFNEALKLVPGDVTATALLKQAKEGQAEMTAAADKKRIYDAWMARGQAALQRKLYPEAIEAFTESLKLVPGDATATKGLADAKAASVPKKDPPKKEPVDPVPMPKPKPKTVEPVPMPMPKPKGVDPVPMPKPKLVDPVPMPMPRPKTVDPVPLPKPKDPMPKPPVAKVDPNLAKIADLMKSADASEDAGKYVEAWQTYKQVLALSPTNADAKKRSNFCLWMEQGRKDLAAGKFAEASKNVDEALKLDPNNDNAKRMAQLAKAKKKN